MRAWALVFFLCSGAAQAAPEATLVEDADGSYLIEGSFEVEAPRRIVWDVLTDYDGLDDFVSSLRHSAVSVRGPDHVIVDQEGVGRVLLVSKRIHVRLEVREAAPSRITFRDVSGRSFEEYAGAWVLSGDDGAVRVGYRLSARPTFKAPGFLARKTMRESVARLLDDVRREVSRRAAPQPTGR